ncbi:hypothetical protein [Peribacillus aracenensis]|nr:hypothetical protein [Peribacillus sp. BBB004]
MYLGDNIVQIVSIIIILLLVGIAGWFTTELLEKNKKRMKN